MSIDLSTDIGSVALANPVMPASGTAGYGTELAAYVDLASLGAFVTKSLAHFEWRGNPPLRTHGTHGGMLNSVGLQGPGIQTWRREQLPRLVGVGARVVVSIWGRSVDDYRRAAELLADSPAEVVAVEVNLSCPNTEAGGALIAHDPEASARVIAATAACGRPRWAKLSPNTERVVELAGAVHDAGAEAVTLINTVLGMSIDPITGRYRLGAGERGGGLSGPAVHPVAVRVVHDVHRAHPALPVIGVGGVATGADALELVRAGARAVQVGTANFDDPRSTARVLEELSVLVARTGASSLRSLVGAVAPGAGWLPDSLLGTVLGYLPVTAPIVEPTRITAGVSSPTEALVSAVVLVLGAVVAVRVGGGVYRRSIVRTGRRLGLRDVL